MAPFTATPLYALAENLEQNRNIDDHFDSAMTKKNKKKNQHYVPRMYLRNFALGEKKAIHLFNVPSKTPVSNAPLKSQCSAPYFYGKDLVIENAFERLEGEVAKIIRNMIKSNTVPKPRTRESADLLNFVLSQYGRTKHAADVQNDLVDKFAKWMLEKNGKFTKDELDLVKIGLVDSPGMAVRNAAQSVLLAMDLKMKLLVNRTDFEFITSDNPVVFYNQCYERSNLIVGTGLACKGIQIFLPLSPTHLLVLYDSKVYKIGEKKSDSCNVSNPKDVWQFNDLQYLNCVENLYSFSEFTKPGTFLLEQRNATRTRGKMPMLNESDHGERPDGTQELLLHIIKPDIRIGLSVQPIRQLITLSEEGLKEFPRPQRNPSLVILNKEFWQAVEAKKYAPNEILRFVKDKIQAHSTNVFG